MPIFGGAESENTVSFGGNGSKYQEDSIAGRNAMLFLSLEDAQSQCSRSQNTLCRAIKPDK